MVKMTFLSSVLYCLILSASVEQSLADPTRRSPSDDSAFTAGPFYNNATKSYFELIRLNQASWEKAVAEAANHKYKNITGQLATINRPETHKFIVNNFVFLQDTWIGLRFYCENSTLEWTQKLQSSQSSFSYWISDVDITNLRCPVKGYLTTYINRNAFDWNLGDNEKFANYSLIEYPTNKK
ncbi:MAG: hypothetical protein JKY84_00550 [Emcibacteraceae bacterium]|nr:hypothetical protein [Emcibacteraceae bacterium]